MILLAWFVIPLTNTYGNVTERTIPLSDLGGGSAAVLVVRSNTLVGANSVL